MMECSKCGREAVIFVRYSGAHLCKGHFLDFFRRRAKKEIRKQMDLGEVEHIAVGISGGKDSAAALQIIHDVLGDVRNMRVTAITVDEGIEGYRPRSIESARKLCEMLGVRHEIIGFQDTFGITLDDAAGAGGHLGPCSYCGVWRKKCLNQRSREIGADVLAVGHNLDDTAQSILMNVFRGEIKKLVRMGPHRRTRPGLVPRIMPLRTIPEKETYLFAFLTGIPFEDLECPYAVAAHRGLYRDMINSVEDGTPGTRHRILRSHQEIYECLAGRYQGGELGRCGLCGEPTSKEICKACEMVRDIRARMGGGKDDEQESAAKKIE